MPLQMRERYNVIPIPVNAADYGVPQVRHRVIIVGFRSDLGINEDLWRARFAPRKTHSEKALFGQLRDPASKYWTRHADVPEDVKKQVINALPPVNLEEDDPESRPWRTLRDAIMGDAERDESPLPQTGLVNYEEHPGTPCEDTLAGQVHGFTMAILPMCSTVQPRQLRPGFTACQAASP